MSILDGHRGSTIGHEARSSNSVSLSVPQAKKSHFASKKKSSPIEEKLRQMRKMLCKQINQLFKHVFNKGKLNNFELEEMRRSVSAINTSINDWHSLFIFALQLLEAHLENLKNGDTGGSSIMTKGVADCVTREEPS